MSGTSRAQDDVVHRARVLLARLDVHIDDVTLLVQALTHRSWAFENAVETTNERLEFLGDAVVGLVVTDLLFTLFPDQPEGVLAKLRSAAVRSETLAELARQQHIGEAVLLGHGETKANGSTKASILADTFEAVIGAVYLDQGFATAYDVVERLFAPLLPTIARQGVALDYKTSLQELAAKRFGELPQYTSEATGPEHQKDFVADVWLDGLKYGSGQAASKKLAEQRAAEAAYMTLQASPHAHDHPNAD